VKIALLKIENFRRIGSGTVRFRDHTVLIGPNNSGKTTIIEALALILGRDRLVRNLTEHDFFGSDPKPADRIRITATITGFEPDDFTEHPEWFLDGRGVPSWFDPETGDVVSKRRENIRFLHVRSDLRPALTGKVSRSKRRAISRMLMTQMSLRKTALSRSRRS
jgi:putative ATP-dependent endonuclease of OLD family